jgi:hypothetical protein
MAEQAEAPDGERVLRAVISHLAEMLACEFKYRGPPLTSLKQYFSAQRRYHGECSEQAAVVARLACVSRASRMLAADLLPVDARRALCLPL